MSKCVACGANQWSLRFHKQGFDFLRCKNCGLTRLDPMPTVEELSAHYESRVDAGNYVLAKAAERISSSRDVLAIVQRHHPNPGRILDIGCFDGQLLDLAKAAGWETWGVELQSEAAAHAGANHRIFTQTIETFDPSGITFDVVTAVALIEHLREPETFMRAVSKILKPGGYFIAQTPNAASLPARLMGRYWFPIAAPEHTHYFSPHTMELLCKRFEFDALTSRADWKKLRIGYAMDQMTFFGPEISRILNFVRPAIPSFIENTKVPMYGGEMFFVARKPCPLPARHRAVENPRVPSANV